MSHHRYRLRRRFLFDSFFSKTHFAVEKSDRRRFHRYGIRNRTRLIAWHANSCKDRFYSNPTNANRFTTEFLPLLGSSVRKSPRFPARTRYFVTVGMSRGSERALLSKKPPCETTWHGNGSPKLPNSVAPIILIIINSIGKRKNKKNQRNGATVASVFSYTIHI